MPFSIANLTCLPARELEEVAGLFARSFPGSSEVSIEKFRFVLREAPRATHVLVRDVGGRLVAGLVIYQRTLDYHGVAIEVCGMSFMAAEQGHRDFSATAVLKDELFRFAGANADVTIGIARKAMDRYWYPYGFTGITNFGELIVNFSEARRDAGDYRVADIEDSDVETVAEFYRETYSGLVGPFIRDARLWKYYLQKARREGVAPRKIAFGKRTVAYFCESGGVVHELGYRPEHVEGVLAILRQLASDESNKSVRLRLQVGLRHPIVPWCRRWEHSQSTRFVWKGGHIARIESLHGALCKLAPVIQARAARLGLPEFELTLGDAQIGYRGGKLSIEASGGRQGWSLDRRDWCRLFFGVLDPRDIVGLRDHPKIELIRVLFPQQDTQIPLLDQF